MKRQLLQCPAQSFAAGADKRGQESPSQRRDRGPVPTLQPTVYCPMERVQECVTESR